MENITKENKNEKVDTKVSNTNIGGSLFDLLKIDEEEQKQEQAFLRHEVKCYVNFVKEILSEAGVNDKVQIQTKSIDEETGELVDFTFTLNSGEKNTTINKKVYDLKDKVIFVSDLIRYTTVHRDMKDRETARTQTFGGEYSNSKIIDEDISGAELNSYVIVELNSVANVSKKVNGKTVATGDVKLISIKSTSEGIQTFSCKFKHDLIGMKLNRGMFEPAIGKNIKINGIKDSRINGTIYYSTEVMPDTVK
jgi:hypothetical protein